MSRLYIVLFFLAFSQVLHAGAPKPPSGACESIQEGGRAFLFCGLKQKATENSDTLLFLHGAGTDQKELVKSLQEFYAEFKKAKRDIPRIVGVSLGPIWVLAPRNSAPESGMYEYFSESILPALETRGSLTGRKFLVGRSMGGLNALMLMARRVGYFSKVALLCPALLTVSTYSGESEIQDYIRRNQASESKVRFFLSQESRFFGDRSSVEESSFLGLVSRNLTPDSPPFYVAANLQDEYGVQEGARSLYNLSRELKLPLLYQEFPGKHCELSLNPVVQFLSP